MQKRINVENSYRSGMQPLGSFFVLERRNMTDEDSYYSLHPEKYGSRLMWQLFEMCDNYRDAIDAFNHATSDLGFISEYDWRLSEWTAKCGPDGAVFTIKTVLELFAQGKDSLRETTVPAEDDESASERQFASLMNKADGLDHKH